MKTALTMGLIVALVLAPVEAYAQHGRGGGGYRGGGGGGGYHGGAGGGMQTGRTASTARRSPSGVHQQIANRGAYYNHRPAYHGNWYHGSWHGQWAHPYAYRPWGWYGGGGLGWGLGIGFGTGLAVGAVGFGSPWGWGYYPYYNPYWGGPAYGVTYINYGQPIVVAPPAAAPAVQPTPPGPSDAVGVPSSQEKGLAIFDSARSYFKRGDYPIALAETNKAVAMLPNDTLMHEFRGLCLFAMKDYQQSAAAVYAVLAIGPGWDATTLTGLYPNMSVYTEQLRALENYRNEKPEAPDARFLLAYHYMLAGHNEQAAAELQTVVELEPKDLLSAQLLKGLTTRSENQQAAPAGPELPTGEPVEAESLVGNWKASRPDGTEIELSLTKDNKFNWNFSQDDKKQQLKGTYTVANNYLILAASGQNALVGQVALTPGDKLKFKLAGGSPADPGLTFTR